MTARRLANPRNVPAARQGIHLGIVPDSAAARSLRRGPDREIARPPDAFAPDRDPVTGACIGGSVHHAACRAAGRGICAQPRHLPGLEARLRQCGAGAAACSMDVPQYVGNRHGFYMRITCRLRTRIMGPEIS